MLSSAASAGGAYRPFPSKIRWNHGADQEIVALKIGIHRRVMQLSGEARDMSSQEDDKGDGGPFIWLGLALFAPVTLFYLYSQARLRSHRCRSSDSFYWRSVSLSETGISRRTHRTQRPRRSGRATEVAAAASIRR